MLKRILPFFITFALGIAIASLFVNMFPSFEVKKTDCMFGHDGDHQLIFELQNEIRDLKIENESLKNNPVEDFNSPVALDDDMFFEDGLFYDDSVVPSPAVIEPKSIR